MTDTKILHHDLVTANLDHFEGVHNVFATMIRDSASLGPLAAAPMASMIDACATMIAVIGATDASDEAETRMSERMITLFNGADDPSALIMNVALRICSERNGVGWP